MFYNALLIFLMAILGIWKAVPLGLLLKTPPTTIFLMTAAGGSAGVLILFFFGDLLRRLFRRKHPAGAPSRRSGRVQRIFSKYGTTGLGFFGSLILGPNPTILLGVLLVPQKYTLLYWTLAGTVVWSLALTITGVYSIEMFREISGSLSIF
ncbi:MAG: hypothetical protein ACLFPE_09380 [Bacteroidales bacterium]